MALHGVSKDEMYPVYDITEPGGYRDEDIELTDEQVAWIHAVNEQFEKTQRFLHKMVTGEDHW